MIDEDIKKGRGCCYVCERRFTVDKLKKRPKSVGGDLINWCNTCYRIQFVKLRKLRRRTKI